MDSSKLKAKPLTTVELVELFLKAEDACKYTERFYGKIEAYLACKGWSKKLDICMKNMLLVQQEMRAKLEEQGAFEPIKES